MWGRRAGTSNPIPIVSWCAEFQCEYLWLDSNVAQPIWDKVWNMIEIGQRNNDKPIKAQGPWGTWKRHCTAPQRQQHQEQRPQQRKRKRQRKQDQAAQVQRKPPQVQRKQPRTAQNCKNDLQAHQLGQDSRQFSVVKWLNKLEASPYSQCSYLRHAASQFSWMWPKTKINWLNTNPFSMT